MQKDFNAKTQRRKDAKGSISAFTFHSSALSFASLRLRAFALKAHKKESNP
jgi:hypothetical protein